MKAFLQNSNHNTITIDVAIARECSHYPDSLSAKPSGSIHIFIMCSLTKEFTHFGVATHKLLWKRMNSKQMLAPVQPFKMYRGICRWHTLALLSQ